MSAAARRVALAVAAAALAALVSGAARAQPSARGRLVILFSVPSGEALGGRLEAELVAAGLTPRRVTIAAAARFDELAGIVTAAHADGAIRVEADGAGAEVWIADPLTGRALLRQSLSADASPAMTSVIALRTVEFLRASLLPAEAPAPLQRATPPAAAIETPPPFEGARLRLSLAPAWLASAGGVGGNLAAAAIVSLRLHGRLGVEALGLASLADGQLDAAQGDTRVSAWFAGAGATFRYARGARWSGDVAAGALVGHLRATGAAAPGFVSDAASMTGVAPYARAGAAVDVASWLGFRADVLVGDLEPRAVVRVASRDVATWGRPFGAVMLGVQGGVP